MREFNIFLEDAPILGEDGVTKKDRSKLNDIYLKDRIKNIKLIVQAFGYRASFQTDSAIILNQDVIAKMYKYFSGTINDIQLYQYLFGTNIFKYAEANSSLLLKADTKFVKYVKAHPTNNTISTQQAVKGITKYVYLYDMIYHTLREVELNDPILANFDKFELRKLDRSGVDLGIYLSMDQSLKDIHPLMVIRISNGILPTVNVERSNIKKFCKAELVEKIDQDVLPILNYLIETKGSEIETFQKILGISSNGYFVADNTLFLEESIKLVDSKKYIRGVSSKTNLSCNLVGNNIRKFTAVNDSYILNQDMALETTKFLRPKEQTIVVATAMDFIMRIIAILNEHDNKMISEMDEISLDDLDHCYKM